MPSTFFSIAFDQRVDGLTEDANAAFTDLCGLQSSFIKPSINRQTTHIQSFCCLADPEQVAVHHDFSFVLSSGSRAEYIKEMSNPEDKTCVLRKVVIEIPYDRDLNVGIHGSIRDKRNVLNRHSRCEHERR